MESEESRITAGDVRELNRAVLRATARAGRAAGTGLLVIGAVGAALWLWIVLRQQDVIGGGEGRSPSASTATIPRRRSAWTCWPARSAIW
ncbi:MAG TPA: hypothetical protein VM263_00810 [Acidimicrobiales bacterium]|nr:hypothetical protein [Acidimicrobiales bacterium]